MNSDNTHQARPSEHFTKLTKTEIKPTTENYFYMFNLMIEIFTGQRMWIQFQNLPQPNVHVNDPKGSKNEASVVRVHRQLQTPQIQSHRNKMNRKAISIQINVEVK